MYFLFAIPAASLLFIVAAYLRTLNPFGHTEAPEVEEVAATPVTAPVAV